MRHWRILAKFSSFEVVWKPPAVGSISYFDCDPVTSREPVDRFGALTPEQFSDIKTVVQRGGAVTALPAAAPASGEPIIVTEMPSIMEEVVPVAAPAPALTGPQHLARTRPRRR